MLVNQREDVRIQCVTIAMTALSTIVIELAVAEPGQSTLVSFATAAAWLIPVPVISLIRWRSFKRRPSVESDLAPISVFLVPSAFLLPFLVDAGRVIGWGRGVMLEISLIMAVRNVGLVLATLSDRVIFSRLAALVSLFMIAVCSAMAEGTIAVLLVGIYAGLGCLWLMMSYWKRLRLPSGGDTGSPLPLLSAGLVFAMIASVLGLAMIGPTRTATALAGLMPTSGGTFWDDPDARSGVNDGDNEVAAVDKPESVGFAESDVYLETDRPSLYDAFTEKYGEPFKQKKQEKMIALGQQDILEQKERPSENLRAGREFPLTRKKPNQPTRKPGDRQPRALLYVKGKAPVHLPIAAYDQFDGESWIEADHGGTRYPLVPEETGSWIRIDKMPPNYYAGTVSHQIKVGSFDSRSMAIPSQPARFRVGQVNRVDFFEWVYDGILGMSGRNVPAGTVIDTETYTIDYRRLANDQMMPQWVRHLDDREASRKEGYRIDPSAAALARSWIADAPSGWKQIDAVVTHLRREYTFDPASTSSIDTADSLTDFLMNTRRGPDYQFATAAALLLRSIGYRTRVVSGFYASPAKYDPRTHHTHVDTEDAHFWVEVSAAGTTWVAIEPTPGYQLAEPVIPWIERIAAIFIRGWEWLNSHPQVVVALGVICVFLYRFRFRAAELFATIIWMALIHEEPRRRILRTLRLVEHRAGWAGFPRQSGQTPQRWFRLVSANAPEELRDEFRAFLRLADWARYAPEDPSALAEWPIESIQASCRRVVRTWTIDRLRRSALTA